MKKALAIIPARYESSRFPGKPLVEIHGKSMIMRVYEQALKAALLKDVYVATDNDMIFNHVMQSGGKAVMTSQCHKNGTERCLEAFIILSGEKKCSHDEIIINIQGDEPFVHPDQVDALISVFDRPEVRLATLIKRITCLEEINNPDSVKVVIGKNGLALYFSRLPIPFIRDKEQAGTITSGVYYKHIGMYAYTSAILEEICRLEPSPLENAEKLEQLRWLENGHTIHVEVTEHESIAIDSPADLLKVTNIT